MELKRSPFAGLPFLSSLLIVPYGIETGFSSEFQFPVGLLIVPYGIETCVNAISSQERLPFNRTLWN